MEMPESMDSCFYFTNRKWEKGSCIAWVRKPDCPKCGKAKLGKPVDPKTGKIKSRADFYVCSACNYKIAKAELDATLKVEAEYTCPACGESGEGTTEFKRKSFKGVPAYILTCEKCGEKIALTKKMKKPKK